MGIGATARCWHLTAGVKARGRRGERSGDGVADTSTMPDPLPQSAPRATAGRALLRALHEDRVLLSAFVLSALLIIFQLTITLVHPSCRAPTTNSLRAPLACP